jgi:hypothetical protein
MSGESLPSAVKDFLARYIRSVEQLEVLLLLRSQPARSWTATEVYEVVRSSLGSIGERLEGFCDAGFFVKTQNEPPAFRYAEENPQSRAVDEVAAAYRTWRVRIIETIFTAEVDPLKSFSDAFRIRKE